MEFNQNQEIFRAVDRFLNYEVSNHGRVRNCKTGLILKQSPNSGGYLSVYLGKKRIPVHRIISEAFIPNPNNYNTVDHISKNKLDNSIDNLRWASESMQARNQPIRIDNTSNVKGLTYYKANERWGARITNNDGKRITKSFAINKFENAKELAKAWRRQKEIEFDYTPV